MNVELFEYPRISRQEYLEIFSEIYKEFKRTMKETIDYGAVFEKIVEKTAKYLVDNNIKAQILGISGGIDSTVVAAICHEVSERTGIPLIGRSLPTNNNKEGEVTTADLVGKAFCTNYKEVSIQEWYINSWSFNEHGSEYNAIADGNIQARLRMIYLYNLAGIHRGLVMDTDNLTENNLGYFTIHGDVGDFNPIGGLWKTEVFKLAEYLVEYYSEQYKREELKKLVYQNITPELPYKVEALSDSLQLKPTAGLGITNNDLEEIGAESYDQVDAVLQDILAWKWRENMFAWHDRDLLKDYLTEVKEKARLENIPMNIIENVTLRHFKSEFKREQLPIKITRDEIL